MLITPHTDANNTGCNTQANGEYLRYLSDLKLRIASCRRKQPLTWLLRKDVNCAGTAIYLVGDASRDGYIETITLYNKYLSSLKQVDSPVAGCLIAWVGRYGISWRARLNLPSEPNTCHIGVVSATDPPRVTHRDGLRGSFVIDAPIDAVESEISTHIFSRKLYLPSTMMAFSANDAKS